MTEPKPIDVNTIPETQPLAREVARTRVQVVLTTAEEDITVLTTVAKAPRQSRRAKPITADAPLFAMIGIGQGQTSGGVSERKHEALARAYRPKL